MTDFDLQLHEAAEAGDRDAAFQLGFNYFRRKANDQDAREAVRWWRRAADAGHPLAQQNFATAYLRGELGLPKDPQEALTLFKLAAEQGQGVSQKELGLMYEMGNGTAKNLETAAYWYTLAAKHGISEAQHNLGIMYSEGKGVAQNHEEAARLYRLAADQGYQHAQHTLGWMYRLGQGVSASNARAFRWFRLAAEKNHPPAQQALSQMYYDGAGVAQNFAEAMRLARLSARNGYPQGCLTVGVFLHNGVGQEQDSALASAWMALAAHDRVDNARDLARQYAEEHDAALWPLLDKAIDGDVETLATLAKDLGTGSGWTQDEDAGQCYVRKAAELGHAASQTTLGILLRRSELQEDQQASTYWLQRATENGDVRGKYVLGSNVFFGIGTKLDEVKGASLMLEASLAGDLDARQGFTHLATDPGIKLPSGFLESVYEQTEWPTLTFILGPTEAFEGENEIRSSWENGETSEHSAWRQYDQKVTNMLFGQPDGSVNAFLEPAFEREVTVRDFFVGLAYIEGKPATSVSISLRNVLTEDGAPVWWPPNQAGLDAAASLMGLLGGRRWMRTVIG